jgi:hypothetical protein
MPQIWQLFSNNQPAYSESPWTPWRSEKFILFLLIDVILGLEKEHRKKD